MRIKCLLKGHDWRLIGTDSTCRFVDVVCVIHLSFYECACCGKRTAGGRDRGHIAAREIKRRWVKAGALPKGKPKAKLKVIK